MEIEWPKRGKILMGLGMEIAMRAQSLASAPKSGGENKNGNLDKNYLHLSLDCFKIFSPTSGTSGRPCPYAQDRIAGERRG